MMNAEERHNKFLSTYVFHTNSIQFRIHSSVALEKWKNVQAFQLDQLVNGRYYFPYDRREILLLKYDLWSRWLYEVENLCIEYSGEREDNITTADDVETILGLSDKTQVKLENIMRVEHKENFDELFIEIWIQLQNLIIPFFKESIRKLVGLSFDKLFSNIVNILVEIMQYTLMEIHELDILFCKSSNECNECIETGKCSINNIEPNNSHYSKIIGVANRRDNIKKDETPFLIVSDYSEKIMKEKGICLICERLNIYRRYFDIKEVFFKNYTDDLITPELLNRVENQGVNIDYKKSVLQSP